eukprot:7134274-Prymnesium_polylepis.1
MREEAERRLHLLCDADDVDHVECAPRLLQRASGGLGVAEVAQHLVRELPRVLVIEAARLHHGRVGVQPPQQVELIGRAAARLLARRHPRAVRAQEEVCTDASNTANRTSHVRAHSQSNRQSLLPHSYARSTGSSHTHVERRKERAHTLGRAKLTFGDDSVDRTPNDRAREQLVSHRGPHRTEGVHGGRRRRGEDGGEACAARRGEDRKLLEYGQDRQRRVVVGAHRAESVPQERLRRLVVQVHVLWTRGERASDDERHGRLQRSGHGGAADFVELEEEVGSARRLARWRPLAPVDAPQPVRRQLAPPAGAAGDVVRSAGLNRRVEVGAQVAGRVQLVRGDAMAERDVGAERGRHVR